MAVSQTKKSSRRRLEAAHSLRNVLGKRETTYERREKARALELIAGCCKFNLPQDLVHPAAIPEANALRVLAEIGTKLHGNRLTIQVRE